MTRRPLARLPSSVVAALAATSFASAQDTTLVSANHAGTAESNAPSTTASRCVALEKRHRLVVFESRADDLVKGDFNGSTDIFLRDVDDGVTTRVSVDAKGGDPDGGSTGASITPDGRFVGFTSFATDLVKGDTNGAGDAFLLDRGTGVIERVSLDVKGNEIADASRFQAVSDDGDFVVFVSSSDQVVSGDANGEQDVFVRIRSKALTLCASLVAGGTTTGNDFAGGSSLSADGRKVLFQSSADDLVANDTNQGSDLFLYDVSAGTLERVSLNASGLELDADSETGCLARDGASIAFLSAATNLHGDATSGDWQVYWKDLATGDVVLVSRGIDGLVQDGGFLRFTRTLLFDYDDGVTLRPQVAFLSEATNLFDDGRDDHDHFVVDVASGIGQCISVDSAGVDPDVSDLAVLGYGATPDGRAIAFTSHGAFDPLDVGGYVDVYLRGLEWVAPTEYGVGLAGRSGFVPHLSGRGGSAEDGRWSIALADGLGGAFGLLWVGLGRTGGVPLFGGTFYVDFAQPFFSLPVLLGGAAGVPGAGELALFGVNVEGLGPLDLHLQCMLLDAGASKGISLSNALELSLGGF